LISPSTIRSSSALSSLDRAFARAYASSKVSGSAVAARVEPIRRRPSVRRAATRCGFPRSEQETRGTSSVRYGSKPLYLAVRSAETQISSS
jgi:hypothetical protein